MLRANGPERKSRSADQHSRRDLPACFGRNVINARSFSRSGRSAGSDRAKTVPSWRIHLCWGWSSMNWITIAWTLVASEAMEEILTHLWKVLVGQLHGPLAFRLILQPSVAVILAIRAGLGDARAGRPAYFWAVLMDLDHRKDLLREGWKDVGKIFVLAVVLDVICQLIVFRWLYPGEALLVASVLAILPYLVVRGPVNRIATFRTKDSNGR
jgi:hypothetical protein